jgi:hypothetical protein
MCIFDLRNEEPTAGSLHVQSSSSQLVPGTGTRYVLVPVNQYSYQYQVPPRYRYQVVSLSRLLHSVYLSVALAPHVRIALAVLFSRTNCNHYPHNYYCTRNTTKKA